MIPTTPHRSLETALQVAALMAQGQVVELDQTLATARASSATLWTQDVDRMGIENVEYISRKPPETTSA